MSTPFSVNDAKEIDPFVSIHKIASFEINHIRLIEFLAQTKKPLIISTGMATIDEIGEAVDTARSSGCKNLILLKCTGVKLDLVSNSGDQNSTALAELIKA